MLTDFGLVGVGERPLDAGAEVDRRLLPRGEVLVGLVIHVAAGQLAEARLRSAAVHVARESGACTVMAAMRCGTLCAQGASTCVNTWPYRLLGGR